jgi:hypothetical protein
VRRGAGYTDLRADGGFHVGAIGQPGRGSAGVMTGETPAAEGGQLVSARQGKFIRYMLFVLVDLTVLNLFVQYWDRVVIDSFMISLFAAALLQVLLKVTLAIEHRVGRYFHARSGPRAVIQRVLATWVVLFGSKFVILEAVDIVFGDHVDLGGLVPFIVLVVALLAAEALLTRIYETLA